MNFPNSYATKILEEVYKKPIAEIAAEIKNYYSKNNCDISPDGICFGEILRYRRTGKAWRKWLCETFDLVAEFTRWERDHQPPHKWIYNQKELDYSI